MPPVTVHQIKLGKHRQRYTVGSSFDNHCRLHMVEFYLKGNYILISAETPVHTDAYGTSTNLIVNRIPTFTIISSISSRN
jgi:hypothetical protein